MINFGFLLESLQKETNSLQLAIKNLLILFDLDVSSRTGMLIAVALHYKRMWSSWKEEGLLEKFYDSSSDDLNELQQIGDEYIRTNADYIIHSERIHGLKILKSIGNPLNVAAKHEFDDGIRKIQKSTNAEEGMKRINNFYKKWYKAQSIGAKIHLFQEVHWIKHSFPWAKDLKSSTS